MKTSASYDAAEFLETDEDVGAYLNAVLEDGDPSLASTAIGDISRVHKSSISRDDAERRLMVELERGLQSADERGRLSTEQLCARVAITLNQPQKGQRARYNSTTEKAMEEARSIMSRKAAAIRYDSFEDMISSLDGLRNLRDVNLSGHELGEEGVAKFGKNRILLVICL